MRPGLRADLKKRKLRLIRRPGAKIQAVVKSAVEDASPEVVKHARKLIFGGES